ncbi:acetate/propionate family kinase [Legionella genomosp. 1]|uniref:acetate/propionate family kinase n=1 Tax=Legionella genomosp. 1 TaxID=1093625 RepID=UPI0010550DE9
MNLAINSILVLNVGSSSVKFQMFVADESLELLASGKVFNIGGKPVFAARVDEGPSESLSLAENMDQRQAVEYIFNWIEHHECQWKILTVAHRIVHGGERYKHSVLITPDVIDYLKTLCPLAPLHQPYNIAGVEYIYQLGKSVIQIACFDTAFHAGHEPLFTEYALPETIRKAGVRRYGFHGLSYEWISYYLDKHHSALNKDLIIAAHLGNGASLCAMSGGRSVDTTMGLTALDGLPMGTRCGSIDPGVIPYLVRQFGLSIEEVESLLYRESGLKGLSGWTNDVQLLEKSEDKKAQFAMDFFCLKVAQYMAMMAISLRGVDHIIFTGGIGENSMTVRKKILDAIHFLPVRSVLVISANEEKMMALHSLAILNKES